MLPIKGTEAIETINFLLSIKNSFVFLMLDSEKRSRIYGFTGEVAWVTNKD